LLLSGVLACVGEIGGGDPTPVAWPNEMSQASSDPWLAGHHDRISSMAPRVLVLNFQNGVSDAVIAQRAREVIAGLALGSRHRGYADPTAVPFLQYQLLKVVNLTDSAPPPDWAHPGSTLLPRKPEGGFDYAQLFTGRFADHLGFQDPSTPSRNLSLCQLFEQGVVHEVWISAWGDPDKPEEFLERKQVYDQAGRKVPGQFNRCAGNGCFATEADAGGCAVSVRIGELAFGRGPGCALHAQGHAMEGMGRALPYFRVNSERFFNFGMVERYATAFDSFYDCRPDGRCIDFLSPDHVVSAPEGGLEFDIPRFGQGCGNVHFAPNSTAEYDYQGDNRVMALSACASYGMRDGPLGADHQRPYTYDLVQEHDQQFRDCGGGWQIYMRQSMPGYGNRAFDIDQGPMKNWWPFLFY
jgi:hypothetical protein